MNTLESTAAGIAPPAQTSPNPQYESEMKPAPAVVRPAPILITEKEVLFSTAAAVPVRPTTTRWWPAATRSFLTAMHEMLLTSWVDSREPRRDFPRRYEFLEYSCMAREMDRL
jgi:hypothetical protein